MFLFAGNRLRFGRNRRSVGPIANDLMLRGFPRAGEDQDALRARTRSVSRHHGCFRVTRGGIEVEDSGSTHGTSLDGRALSAGQPAALPDGFELRVGGHSLRGRVIRDGPAKTGSVGPAGAQALLLERADEDVAHSYLLVIGSASVGGGEKDALRLPGLPPHCASLTATGERFAISSQHEDVQMRVDGEAVLLGTEHVLSPGSQISLGSLQMRFELASDDDMKP
ncbi:MAG TPA: hypothetical protein DEA08_25025 [Planctomycetes bacterium]|nr:hypothetical protein [Planctomycetota bacterium]